MYIFHAKVVIFAFRLKKSVIKKLILIFGLLVLVTTLKAQEIAKNTVGLRLGVDSGLGFEATIQHQVFLDKRIELGVGFYDDINASILKATIGFQKVMPLNFMDNLNWYAGVGIGLGVWKPNANFISQNALLIELDAITGIEYKFDFPFIVSLDFKPGITKLTNQSTSFIINHNVGIGLRYTLDF